mmetsp:Transcript_10885/g.39974  ORF Transcript_10885/g.39974 Transcript_10885/m.39974 type:complete len:236 (+) Transcript_10885:1722-2429(+)
MLYDRVAGGRVSVLGELTPTSSPRSVNLPSPLAQLAHAVGRERRGNKQLTFPARTPPKPVHDLGTPLSSGSLPGSRRVPRTCRSSPSRDVHCASAGASAAAPSSPSALERRSSSVRVPRTLGGSTRAPSAAPTRARSASDNSKETAGLPPGHKCNVRRRRQSASASPSRRTAASSRSAPCPTLTFFSAARFLRESAHSASRPLTLAMASPASRTEGCCCCCCGRAAGASSRAEES